MLPSISLGMFIEQQEGTTAPHTASLDMSKQQLSKPPEPW
jgi:hypothetical protein